MKKAALITGGAKRLGREMALSLAKQGYEIAFTYNHSAREAEKTRRDINEIGTRCESFKVDFSNDKDLSSLIGNVIKEFTDLNLLINSASIFKPSQISKTTLKLFDESIKANLRAPFFISQEFAKRVSKGQIINLLDTRIASKRSSYAAYSITKMALADFTKLAAVEFAPKIRVNGIAPGLILPPEGKTKDYLKELAKNVPMKDHGNVENILKTVQFLTDNEYVTGQIIFCDGGEHLSK